MSNLRTNFQSDFVVNATAAERPTVNINDRIITVSRFHGGNNRPRCGFLLSINYYYIIIRIVIKIIEFHNSTEERSVDYNRYFQELNKGGIIQLPFFFSGSTG